MAKQVSILSPIISSICDLSTYLLTCVLIPRRWILLPSREVRLCFLYHLCLRFRLLEVPSWQVLELVSFLDQGCCGVWFFHRFLDSDVLMHRAAVEFRQISDIGCVFDVIHPHVSQLLLMVVVLLCI